MSSSEAHRQAMVEGRHRAGYSEERPRRVEYRALGCAGCNRPFGAGHDDWCKVLDPGPAPHPDAAIVPAPGHKQCRGPCGLTLAETIENFQRTHSGGFWPICKPCHLEKVKAGRASQMARTKGRYGEGVA